MLNVGKGRELVELMIQQSNPDYHLNPVLFREILNIKLREFVSQSGIRETKATISSVADTQEYELPAGLLHISEVHYDDYKAHKITFSQVQEMKDQVS